ncbi:magnesium transporter [Blautia sp. MSJ-19]|uniref:magnesium transporter n=1 Tax=Blautia sp. MSJ-19 TaxID=2841517 RepID=UPI001C0EABB3|nr:magnesium transporter [Blautia sp. MSJ-19]MBU5481492.1 magnesium transporter [Blautia sp. MSJ-19]
MEKRVQDYSKEILDIVKSNTSPAMLCKRLQDFHENDIADVLELLSVTERCKLYRILDMDTLSDIFEYTEEEDVVKYLEEMDVKKAAAILSKMETNVLSDVLQQFDRSKRKILVELLDDDVRHDIEIVMSFDEDEIGSRMTTNYIVIHENITVKEAMNELVEQAARNDNISTIFVVSNSDEFYGAIDLKDLIIARQDHALEELIVTSYPYVYGTELIDDCIEDLKDYSEDSIPVLDNDNRLLGVITSANIVDLVDDEMGEDYAKLAGLTAEEDLREPLKESVKKRMPWLVILLGLGMVVSSVVGIFEKVVTHLPIIMCFQSLILDMAGNVGTQSLAVTIRVLMDESLTGKQKLELVWKEMRIGLCNGGVLGTLSFALIGVYIWLIKGKTLLFAYAVSGCIGISLLLAMLISSAVGTCIPLFFKKIHVDPAVASGPLITTVNDLVAVISYYGLSWILLIQILHLAG